MKKGISVFLLLAFILFIPTSCSSETSSLKDIKVTEDFFKSGSNDKDYVELAKINDNVWVHTSYGDFNGSRTPSNGLVIITSKGLTMVDTPWNPQQTRELIKLAKDTFKKEFVLAVITHAHADRIGGIATLLEDKIDVRSTGLTAKEAEKLGFKKPEPKLDTKPDIKLGDTEIETFYPGQGHTIDNITVWLPKYKILFGGCLIKSDESKDIGNTADANVEQWPISVQKVLDKYPDAEIVIPGHGKWGSTHLIQHTLELLEVIKNEQ